MQAHRGNLEPECRIYTHIYNISLDMYIMVGLCVRCGKAGIIRLRLLLLILLLLLLCTVSVFRTHYINLNRSMGPHLILCVCVCAYKIHPLPIPLDRASVCPGYTFNVFNSTNIPNPLKTHRIYIYIYMPKRSTFKTETPKIPSSRPTYNNFGEFRFILFLFIFFLFSFGRPFHIIHECGAFFL